MKICLKNWVVWWNAGPPLLSEVKNKMKKLAYLLQILCYLTIAFFVGYAFYTFSVI